MLHRKYRLTRKADVDRVFRRGRSVSGQDLALKFLPNNASASRAAVLVGTKLSKKAVHRNRIKRRLREVLRLHFERVPAGIDLLVIARSIKLRDAEFERITAAVVDLLSKVKA
jgi:ribonuclease P protein component